MGTSSHRGNRLAIAVAGTVAVGLALTACTAPAATGPSAVTFPIPSQDVVALAPDAIEKAIEEPGALVAALRGMRNHCPRCDHKPLFARYLKPVARCACCGWGWRWRRCSACWRWPSTRCARRWPRWPAIRRG